MDKFSEKLAADALKERRYGIEQAHGYLAHAERWLICLGYDPEEIKTISNWIESLRLDHSECVPEFIAKAKEMLGEP